MKCGIIAHFTLQCCLVEMRLKHTHSNKLKLQYIGLNGNC